MGLYQTKEWREKRAKRIEGEVCAWCGSDKELAPHHTHVSRNIYDYQKKNIIKQLIKEKIDNFEFEESKPGSYRLGKEEYKRFIQVFADEIESRMPKIDVPDYMDLEKDTIVLCKKCHMAIERGLIRCPSCDGYMKRGRTECFKCYCKKNFVGHCRQEECHMYVCGSGSDIICECKMRGKSDCFLKIEVSHDVQKIKHIFICGREAYLNQDDLFLISYNGCAEFCPIGLGMDNCEEFQELWLKFGEERDSIEKEE